MDVPKVLLHDFTADVALVSFSNAENTVCHWCFYVLPKNLFG